MLYIVTALKKYIGERMSAQEAERAGLVSKVFPTEELVNEAVKLGEKIAGMSKVAIAMAKEAVNAADNLPLNEGQTILLPCTRCTHTWSYTKYNTV